MKCHNDRCPRGWFTRLRKDQRHCDTYCKEQCRACKQKYYLRRSIKLHKIRRERRLVS